MTKLLKRVFEPSAFMNTIASICDSANCCSFSTLCFHCDVISRRWSSAVDFLGESNTICALDRTNAVTFSI